MKILGKNLRENTVRVRIENLDDLWYLSGVIRTGDLIRSKTERRVKSKDDISRSGKSTRKTVTLSIKVEKVEFRSDPGSLRLLGTVTSGPEDLLSIGSHHTFTLSGGDRLKIIKNRWSGADLDRLREAEKAALRPKILISVIDVGEAVFGLVRESGVEYVEFSRNIGGKYYGNKRSERKTGFYREVESFISKTIGKEHISAVILAGAGFEKDNLYRFLKERNPGFIDITYVENTGSSGRVGVTEVLRRPAIKEIDKNINAAKDIQLTGRFLEELGKDSGLAVYGLGDVRNAAHAGAIELLLVSDYLFQKNRREIDILMRGVASRRGKVHLVNHENEAGKQLSSLGGVGAILRYRINT